MKEDFDYTEIPKDYTHCLHAGCPRSAVCLRFLVTRHAGAEVKRIPVVNPAYVVGNEDSCSYFQEDRLACFALGITHIFDDLHYNDALKVRRLLLYTLKRNTFYRILNKERLIKPAEMAIIREIFHSLGIEKEPVFDEYFYKYDW